MVSGCQRWERIIETFVANLLNVIGVESRLPRQRLLQKVKQNSIVRQSVVVQRIFLSLPFCQHLGS